MNRTDSRQAIGILLGLAVAATLPQAAPAAPDVSPTRRHVERLASPEMDGRLTGSPGEAAASAYLVAELERIGARSLPGLDSLLLPFEFTAGVGDAGSSLSLTLGGVTTPQEAVRALSFSDQGRVSGPVVFAGYGLVVPESVGFPYDSYAGLDVKDKIVLVLRYFPEDVPPESRTELARWAGLRYKAMSARERGAKALLVVTGPRSPNAGELVPMAFDTALSGSGLVAASLDGKATEALFASLPGKTLEQAQKALDDGNPHVPGFEFPGLAATLEVRVHREKRVGHDVLAFLPPHGPGADASHDAPLVVLGAHYDHLGHGNHGNSLARKGEVGGIHYGADDNASGVAAVLAAGESLATRPSKHGIVLAFWSGEELGLLGSAGFLKQEVLPPERILAYVNLDMVGRMRDNKLTVQAAGTSTAWPRLIEQTNVPVGFDVVVSQDPYLPTDVLSFYQAGVPSLSLFTGGHEDYHRPTDQASRIDYPDLDRVARFAALLAGRLADRSERLDFVKVARPEEARGDRDSVRAFTGTIPDYTAEVEGLRLSGVIEGGPAEEAGLAGGDVIVEFAGRRIANIYDYTYALDAVKIGAPVKVVFLRAGERRETTVTPRARK